MTDELPEDKSPFRLTVRDSDDIDRFDIIRTATRLGECVDEKTNEEIIKSCEEAIKTAERYMSLERGTKTARIMLEEKG